MAKVSCPCGEPFDVPEWKIRAGRGKYCSNECKYRYRSRPSGLVYNIKVENPSWIQPGERLSPDTEFRVGEVPHNWKGDQVGYDALHDWVKRHAGRASTHTCTACGHDGGERPLHWANLSHQYRRDLTDWAVLCCRCHIAYDRRTGWGDAAELFHRFGRQRLASRS